MPPMRTPSESEKRLNGTAPEVLETCGAPFLAFWRRLHRRTTTKTGGVCLTSPKLSRPQLSLNGMRRQFTWWTIPQVSICTANSRVSVGQFEELQFDSYESTTITYEEAARDVQHL